MHNKTPHSPQIQWGKALDPWELLLYVGGEAFDNGLTPTFLLLSQDDIPADLPVEQNELAAYREVGASLRGSDASLEVAEKQFVGVGGRN